MTDRFWCAAGVPTPPPLVEVPFTAPTDDGPCYVEVYEHVAPGPAPAPETSREIGASLAGLHRTPIGSGLPTHRRIAVARARLVGSRAPGDRKARLRVQLHHLEALLESCGGPVGLIHTDASNLNRVYGESGPVWVDWEYAGAGPYAFDVALAFGACWRFEGPEAAQELLEGYFAAGGPAPPAAVTTLFGAYEVVAAADIHAGYDVPALAAEARLRAEALGDPLRVLRFHRQADLLAGPAPPRA